MAMFLVSRLASSCVGLYLVPRAAEPSTRVHPEGDMEVQKILAAIDHEIAQLQQARALLSGGAAPTSKKKGGRPKKTAAAVVAPAKPARKKRKTQS